MANRNFMEAYLPSSRVFSLCGTEITLTRYRKWVKWTLLKGYSGVISSVHELELSWWQACASSNETLFINIFLASKKTVNCAALTLQWMVQPWLVPRSSGNNRFADRCTAVSATNREWRHRFSVQVNSRVLVFPININSTVPKGWMHNVFAGVLKPTDLDTFSLDFSSL